MPGVVSFACLNLMQAPCTARCLSCRHHPLATQPSRHAPLDAVARVYLSGQVGLRGKSDRLDKLAGPSPTYKTEVYMPLADSLRIPMEFP